MESTIGTALPHHPSSRLNLALVAVLLGNLVCAINVAVVGSLESWIVDDLAVPHALTGLAQSALFAGNLIGSLITSWLMYRMKPRRFALLIFAVMVLGNAVCTLRSYELFVFGRFVTGLGYAGAIIFVGAVVVHGYPNKQAVVLGIMQAALAACVAITLAIGRPLAEALGDWRYAFWAVAVACAVPMLAFGMARLPAMHEDEPFSLRAMASAVRARNILATFLVFACFVAAEQGATVFMASYAQANLGLAAADAARIAGLFWIGSAIGRVISAWASRRVHEPPQLVLCVIGMAVFLFATLGIGSAGLLPVLVLLAGAFSGPIAPLVFSYAPRSATRLKSAVLAMSNLAACVGGALGPVIIGAVGDQFGLERGLMVSAVLMLVSLAPFIWAMRPTLPTHTVRRA